MSDRRAGSLPPVKLLPIAVEGDSTKLWEITALAIISMSEVSLDSCPNQFSEFRAYAS